MIRSCPDRLEFKNECYSTVNQINSYIRLNKILNIVILLVYVDTKYQIQLFYWSMQIQITRHPKKVEDDSFKVEIAFSGKALRWNKEKISALIRLMTQKSTIIKFTPSLTGQGKIKLPVSKNENHHHLKSRCQKITG